jgi:hypothetical protein
MDDKCSPWVPLPLNQDFTLFSARKYLISDSIGDLLGCGAIATSAIAHSGLSPARPKVFICPERVTPQLACHD